jgi:hypothetical protein
MTPPSRDPPLSKLIGSMALALAAILAIAGIAHAVAPVKGAKYSGHVNVSASLTVSFKVSRSGTKVTSLKVTPSLPNRCGFGGPPPTETSKPARIKHAKFTAKITEKASSGTVIATAKVTGKFLAKGREKGTVKTTLPNAESCNGSFAYSTKATKSH